MASIPVPGRTPPGEHLGAIPGIVPSLIGDVRGCAVPRPLRLCHPDLRA